MSKSATPKGIPETKYYRALRGKYDDVKSPDGKFRPNARRTTVIMGAVKPGESFDHQMVLTKLVEITRPGKYSIRVRDFDAVSTIVKSNEIFVILAQ